MTGMTGLQTCKCTRLAPFGSYQSTLFKPENSVEVVCCWPSMIANLPVKHRARCRGRKGQSLRPNLMRDGGPIKTSFRKMWYWLRHVEK